MSKEIEIRLFVTVPEDATKEQITEWVDVNFAGMNSISKDNPLKNHHPEVDDREWRYD